MLGIERRNGSLPRRIDTINEQTIVLVVRSNSTDISQLQYPTEMNICQDRICLMVAISEFDYAIWPHIKLLTRFTGLASKYK